MISFSFGSFLFAEMAGTVGLFGDSGGLNGGNSQIDWGTVENQYKWPCLHEHEPG